MQSEKTHRDIFQINSSGTPQRRRNSHYALQWRRRRYLELFGTSCFVALYITILYLQRDPSTAFQARLSSSPQASEEPGPATVPCSLFTHGRASTAAHSRFLAEIFGRHQLCHRETCP